MPSVDNRAVEMSFDNAAFERNLAETVKSLDKLRASLDFANAKKSFADLDAASKGFNLHGIGSAVDGISAKFIALSTIGITALANIVNRAVNAGISITKSLSLDPILTGFREYETNMNSIQTIMSNTASDGTTIEQVGAALDQLNHYADQTIYNFSEMARNIGTFTAAGVDLDTSVGAIKGIANLAAISGSNSMQASTAMYQLSQAIASGTVKLIDWNSVVNAGMGGEVFQKALFETGKAMKTLKDVDMGTSFEEWKDAGNSFRGSLEQGWITAEVLTNTLAGFTGDLTEAQILALGYTKEQAAEILKLGENGREAATKVKTFSQLIGTVREAVGSGWSQSFRILIGDFEEAKALFSGLSDTIGKFVGDNADARNSMLQSWKILGGRQMLLDGFKAGFEGIMSVIRPIQTAFRNIFPPITVKTLYNLSKQFKEFAESLKIGGDTSNKLIRIFNGVFGALEIGWEVVKGIAGLFGDLFSHFDGAGGSILGVADKFGIFVYHLNKTLIEGGKLAEFFDKLGGFIRDPLPALQQLKDYLFGLFEDFKAGNLPGLEIFEGIFARFQNRFESLKDIGDKFDFLSGFFDGVNQVLDDSWTAISDWFSNLGDRLAAEISPGEFDAAVDLVNVGLLGGILAALAAFFKNGVKLDFGGGFINGIRQSFDELTGTLEAMQTKLKSEALLKIAGAIAILTASVLTLSLIDSEDLTKALGAMAIGFGQLMGAFAILGQISGGVVSAAGMSVLAGGMIALAGAILILSFAAKNLSKLDWNELSKGLLGVTVLIGVISAAAGPLSMHSGGMIRAGIGMIALATALNILALAVKSFAEMNWEEMGQGLLGAALGLNIIGAAITAIPGEAAIAKGLSVIAIATALNILALALKSFAEMNWEEMAQGLVGVGVGLGIITAALTLMPEKAVLAKASGILIIAVALNAMALAMKSISDMDWEEIGKSLSGMAGGLLIIVAAARASSSALAGAVSIGIIAGALYLLAKTMKEFGKTDLDEIGKGLLALAGVFVVLGVAAFALSSAIPVLVGLGIALVAIGAGFALFGVGVMALAKAAEMLAKFGSAALDLILELLDAVIERLPKLAVAAGKAFLEFVGVILKGSPPIIESLGILLDELLQLVIDLAPKIGEAVTALLQEFLRVIDDNAGDIIDAGFNLLIEFLTAIRDNIGEVTTLVIEILTEFLDTLAENMDDIVSAGVDVLVEFINGLTENIDDLITAGTDFIIKLIEGFGGAATEMATAVFDVVTSFITELGNNFDRLISAGTDAIIQVISGFGKAGEEIATAATDVVISFIQGIQKNIVRLVEAGVRMVIDLMNGIAKALEDNQDELEAAAKRLGHAIINAVTLGFWEKAQDLWDAAKAIGEKALAYLNPFDGGAVPDSVYDDLTNTGTVGGKSGKSDKPSGNLSGVESYMNTSPRITPVLDLSSLAQDAKSISTLIPSPTIRANLSYDQALGISAATTPTRVESEAVTNEPTEVSFTQNIYAPTRLSTNDIYRETKSQIVLAKERLGVS